MDITLDINFNRYYNIINNNNISYILDKISLFTDQNLYLTGGILRNKVWDILHSKKSNIFQDDCDIIFYDENICIKTEQKIENFLFSISPNINWSVKNQARMHIRNRHRKYINIKNALECFPEKASAIAINGQREIIAPFGFYDILNLKLQPTPFCIENEIWVYNQRIKSKKWLQKYHLLKNIYNPYNFKLKNNITFSDIITSSL